MLVAGPSALAQDVEVYEEFANEPVSVRLTGFNLNGFFPRSTFKRNLGDEKGFGGGAFILFQLGPLSPHFLGIGVEYDHIFRDVAFANGFEERVNSGYVSLKANWRIFPNFRFWIFEPYLEASIGPNFIFTATTILDESTGQNVDFGFDQTNLGLEYGLGVGITFPIRNSWFFDIQYSRSQSSIAEYLVLPDDNTSGFRSVNSSLDHAQLKVGAIYAF